MPRLIESGSSAPTGSRGIALRPIIEAGEALLFGSALILDARPLDAFHKSHLTGSVHIPLHWWRSAIRHGTRSLANSGFWRAEIGALGIDGSRTALIYDDGPMIDAAWVWFLLQHFGVPARIVNGGWPHLIDLPREAGAAPAPKTAILRSVTGSGQAGLAGRAHAERARVIDLGAVPGGAGGKRAARLNLARLVDADGRLKRAAELREVFHGLTVETHQGIVTRCDGDGRSTLAAVALLQAGFRDVHVEFAAEPAGERASRRVEMIAAARPVAASRLSVVPAGGPRKIPSSRGRKVALQNMSHEEIEQLGLA